jgi:DNA-binding transcriptional ArsR family regulator
MNHYDTLRYYFQILGDVNRLKIIKFISNREATVSEIVNQTSMSQPLVSHHLKTLKESKILESKRVGPFIYYRLINPKLLDILGLLEDVLPKEPNSEIFEPMFKCPAWWQSNKM